MYVEATSSTAANSNEIAIHLVQFLFIGVLVEMIALKRGQKVEGRAKVAG